MASNDTQPMDKLKEVSQDLMKALGDKAMGTLSERVGGITDKLEGIADGVPGGKAIKEGGKAAAEGDSPVLGALKGAASSVKDKVTGGGGGSGGGGKATKSTNIIETIDVGVPVSVAYNQWTEFGAFPSFMKKVKSVEAEDENKITFKAKIFWSTRTWQSTILEQVPDERIVWKSKGEKGHVDGAVTFHEIGPNLTRILVVLEYYPKGLFEKTGNIWEAQGRRARAELRHFRRHVMTRTILNPDEVEGWRGVIEDGEVVQSHEEVVEEEQEQAESEGEESEEGAEDEYDESEGDEESEEEPEDEYDDEGEESDEDAEEGEEPEEAEDEYDEPADDADEDEVEEEEPEDEYEEEDEGLDEVPEDEDAEDEDAEDEDAEDEEAEEPEAEEVEDDEAEYEEDEEEEPEEEEPKPRRRRRAS